MNNTKTPESANITLTAQEAGVLLELVDIAVKSAGLRVAYNAAAFHQRIETAFKPVPVAEPSTP
jgi:hypothetical protein